MARDIVYEVIRNAAVYVAEEMGIVLRSTAYSPNIRDRHDHSCAVLSPDGELVAQAEHIPVHLGSMAIGVKNTVEYLVRENIGLEPGDIVLVNNPYIAGTHLNDLLLVKPVYSGDELIGFVASKAHYVDIGGSVPGSISADAWEIYQEGIIIPPVKIMYKNVLQREIISLIESNVRTPRYFRGDLRAQIASLNIGEKRLLELGDKYGVDTLLEAWGYILDYSEKYARNMVKKTARKGVYSGVDYLEVSRDKLLPIKARIEITDDHIYVDYSGTASQIDIPLNAVYGVTVAATTYALKTLIDPDMPFNHGFFRVVDIYAPEGSLLNPKPPASVAGGNVETSQRIVDVIYRALVDAFPERVPAASCGSMNNIMIGGVDDNGETWAFYETIGGGSGARPGLDGVDGVHTNMTNTLNTPIERIEREYPILFIEYSLRRDSGGPGQYRGGLGITRVFKITSGRAVLTIMAERTVTKPWGLKGGLPGSSGRHYVIRSSGEKIDLGGKTSIILYKGDTVYINTPGGGGYGDPCKRDRNKVLEDLLNDKISLEHAKKYYCYEDDL